MPVVSYVDPDSIHNPSSGGVAPATWFTTHESNFRSITGRVGAKIFNSTTEDFTIPGPTTITLDETDFNNGMTLSTANTIIVPASYGGKYLITASIRVLSTPSAANFVLMFIAVNGTQVVGDFPNRASVAGSLDTLSVSTVQALAVADAITLRVQTSGLSDADTEVSTSLPSLSAFWLST